MNAVVEYLDACRKKPFRWGSFDCLTFVHDGLLAQGVKPFADIRDWEYGDASSARVALTSLLKRENVENLGGLYDRYYDRVPYFAREGSIVGITWPNATGGLITGFTSGSHVVFVDQTGLRFLRPQDIRTRFWEIPCGRQ